MIKNLPVYSEDGRFEAFLITITIIIIITTIIIIIICILKE